MRLLILATLLLSANMVYAAEKLAINAETIQEAPDPLVLVDTLIKATENSLTHQKKLRELVTDYKKVEAAAIAKPTDKQLLFKLAKSGKMLYAAIEEGQLADYFPAQLIGELQKLSSISDKKSLPPAQ